MRAASRQDRPSRPGPEGPGYAEKALRATDSRAATSPQPRRGFLRVARPFRAGHFFCLLCCLLFGLPNIAAARPPLIIVLLPGTSLRDWQQADAPHLHQLMAAGAIAVMNTRTARLPNDRARETPASACLTLGAGARAAGGPEALAFLPSATRAPGLSVTAGALYARRMGRAVPPGAEVNTDWPRVLQENQGRGYDLHPGNLADALARQGVRVRAGGGPWSRLVAADGEGVVLPAAWLGASEDECLVWDAGELPGADRAVGAAADQSRRLGGRLLVLSPFVGDGDYAQGRRLAPVLEWGDGVPPGLLRSDSTRQAGLTTDTDFAPTVALTFGQRAFPALPFGSAVSVQPSPDAPAYVARLEAAAYRQASAMRLLPYLAVALAVWLALGTWLVVQNRQMDFWPLPPALLLTLLLAGTPGQVCLGLLTLPVAWLFGRRFGASNTLTWILAAFVLILLGDMLTGSRLMHTGLLGYSSVEGARYYGIGNEAAGVLVGGMLVLARRAWSLLNGPRVLAIRPALLGGLAAVALLLGAPMVGAKAGGMLVALAAFGTFGLAALGIRWTPRTVAGLAGAVLLGMAAVALGDALFSHGHGSHIGGAVARIRQGGAGEAVDLIRRKLAVEGRLATHSAWAVLLWSGLTCLVVLWRLSGTPQTAEGRALRSAGVVAVFSCLALNDAGVLAGSLCLVPLWCESAAGLGKKPPEAFVLPGADVVT